MKQKARVCERVLLAVVSICAVAATAAADLPNFAGSEWIAAANALVLDARGQKGWRAADGASWFVRRTVNAKAVRRAVWTTSALGVYELYVNGRRIGTDFLKPGYTSATRTKLSFAYDVTAQMDRAPGAVNRFAAEVGAGWWRDRITGFAGKRGAFRGVIEIEHEDGSKETVVTKPGDWLAGTGGPVLHSGIYDGEEYDARIPRPFDGDGFPLAVASDEFNGEIVPSVGAEVTLRRDLAMRRGPYVLKRGETLVVDFGQNCAAVPEFRFKAASGTVLTALPGEMLNDAEKGERGADGPKGSVYRANLRIPDDGMRLVYTFAGAGVETYLPRFTFFGYRYLSLSATGDVEIESVTSVPVSSIAAADETGRLETGDPAVNRLIANARWGQLSNYLSVPTDCPQRNERQGWTADAQVFCEAGAFMADTSRFFRKWLRDLRDVQDVRGGYPGYAPTGFAKPSYMRFGWADAGVIIPYVLWRQFGKGDVVRDHWSSMERFVAHVDETRYAFANLPECGGLQYGDWLSCEKLETSGQDAFVDRKWAGKVKPEAETLWDFLGGCYWLMDAEMMERMAPVAGADAAKYAAMRGRALDYVRGRFLEKDDGMLLHVLRDMQTPALFALKCGVVEGEAKARTIELLRQNVAAHGGCLQTGFLGTSILMDTLTENGMADLAYDLLLNHDYPGWLYSVDQGATTVWERWNSYTKERGFGPVGMNSFNHYAYGAVVAWIYRTVAGIASDPSAPGFANVVMRPVPDRRLGFAKAEYRSPRGTIRSHWRYEGDRWIWDFTVPPGATADVTLPDGTAARRYASGDHHVEMSTAKIVGAAAETSADWRPAVRWRGFNLLSHFGRDGRGMPPEFPESDFIFLETNGFNFARLPLDYRFWTKEGRWDEIDDARLGAIDRAIACGRKHGVHVQLAFHRAPGYTVTKPKEKKDLLSDPEALAVCAKHWAHLARRYRGIPNEDLSFNLFNEPPQTPGTNYARVARALLRAIRAEDPSRFIISDGINWGKSPCFELENEPNVGQAARGYQPMRVTHFRQKWLGPNTPWDWPVWPMRVHDPVGVLASHFGKTPLVIENPPAGATARIRFGNVNGRVTVGAFADGRPLGERTLDPSVAGALWTNRTYVAEWKCWRGRYDGTLDVTVPADAKALEIRLCAGDWAQLTAVEFLSGGRTAALAVTPKWTNATDFVQRFVGWEQGFESAEPHPAPRYAGAGQEWLYENSLKPWDELMCRGTFVMVGEAGFAGNLKLAADNLSLWRERGWGWALWDLRCVRDEKTGAVTNPELLDLLKLEYDPLTPFPIVTNAPPHLAEGKRRFQACPSVAVSSGGRIWVSWMTGDTTEGEGNATVLASSGDGGRTWTRPVLYIDCPGPARAMDSGLWRDPDGSVWFFYDQMYGFWDGRGGVWAIRLKDPERPSPGWSQPLRISDGFLKNKPLVTSWGDWLFPVEFMCHAPKRGTYPYLWEWEGLGSAVGREFWASNVFVSRDRLTNPLELVGRSRVLMKNIAPTEQMIVERRNGTLWMLTRTGYGIGESVSSDRGRTWTDVSRLRGVENPSTRFFLGRLRSGALLLVKNGPLETRTDRREIRAYVSDDDGATWTGGLMLDPRYETSYPDAAEAPDGFIHVVNDRNRCSTGEILHHRVTEADVRAGRLVTPGSKLMNLVSFCRRPEEVTSESERSDAAQVWKAAAGVKE